MLLQKLNEMIGKFVIVTTAANNRVQGKILEVGPDYVAIVQEGAPKLRLIPLHSIDNIDVTTPPPKGGGFSEHAGPSGLRYAPKAPSGPARCSLLVRFRFYVRACPAQPAI